MWFFFFNLIFPPNSLFTILRKCFFKAIKDIILKNSNFKIHFLNAPLTRFPIDPQISKEGLNSDGRQSPSNYGKSILIPICVNGYVLGECNAQAPFRGRNGGRFYCYVHIHQNNRHCCQDYSIRFSRYCVNYGLCDRQGTLNFMPRPAPSQTGSEVASDF